MRFLAIDPGISTGWCVLDETGTIVSCHSGNPPLVMLGKIDEVVIERPQVYVRRNSKSDPNDLITLAIQVGRYTERFETRGARVFHVLPSLWKGQTTKDVCHAQWWPGFDAREQAMIKQRGQALSEKARGDMLDAICLAKWAFKNGKFSSPETGTR